MEILKNSLVAVPLKYGASGAALSILMFIITYWMGRNPLIDLKFFDFLILPIFLFFSMKDYKDYRNNGILHFWQGMTVGVLTYVNLALLSGIFIILFLDFFDHQLVDLYITDRLEIIDLKKDEMISHMGEGTYNQSREDIENTSSAILALDDFLKKCLIGLTLTIPIAVILRRREL